MEDQFLIKEFVSLFNEIIDKTGRRNVYGEILGIDDGGTGIPEIRMVITPVHGNYYGGEITIGVDVYNDTGSIYYTVGHSFTEILERCSKKFNSKSELDLLKEENDKLKRELLVLKAKQVEAPPAPSPLLSNPVKVQPFNPFKAIY